MVDEICYEENYGLNIYANMRYMKTSCSTFPGRLCYKATGV